PPVDVGPSYHPHGVFGMAAGVMFGTFSCIRGGMSDREQMGGVGKMMMQSGGMFGTFMSICCRDHLYGTYL
uniref:Reactive oxygen species modulator 1 n=1 Tax=Oncorhynchus tshawytscha TaxID=74940 RepID=A0A8C8HK05_ONCTS